jgi:signal transduction histidine kinase
VETRLTSSGERADSGAKWPDFRRIRWLAVVLPAVSVGLFEFLRHQWLASLLPGWLGAGWPGNVAGALVVAAVVYVFVRFFTNILQEFVLEVARAREEAAVAVERQRIAREMHDRIAQTLFYLTVKLREAEDLMVAGESEEAHRELRTARGETKAAYHQVRAVIADLKQQAELEDFGEAVRHTATELAERLGVRVTCEVVGHATLPISSRQHVLAIIQEALINAHRHGRTQRASVRLKTLGKDAAIEVSDEGAGFDPSAVPREGCYGLAIMEERAQMAGGQLILDSTPGRGTRVTVHLPGATS